MPEDIAAHHLPVLRRTSQLRAEGWSDRRIAKEVAEGRLARVERGFLRWAGDLEPRLEHLSRVEALLERQQNAVASHASAALAHGLAVPNDNPPIVHLTVEPPARVRRRSGYHVHVATLSAEDVVEVHGLRVTSLARTAADLARTSEFTWAVIAADQVLRRGVARADLLAVAEDGPRLKGVDAIRRVAAFADARSGSVAESVSRVTLARAGIPRPTLQCQVIGPQGWVATSDFGWEELRVVGEMDGKEKYTKGTYDPRGRLIRAADPIVAVMKEKNRDEDIRQAAWWPCHWDWHEAWSVRGLGARVRGAFEAAGRRLAG